MKLDIHLRARVFAPVAYAIDEHFGVNHYKLALICNRTSSGLLAADLAGLALKEGFTTSFWVIGALTPIIFLGQNWDATAFAKCSAAYERHPDRLPREAVRFWMRPGVIRVLNLGLGLFFASQDIMGAAFSPSHWMWLHAVTGLWFLVGALDDFFAVLPPSGRPRRKVLDRLKSWARGLSFGPQLAGVRAS